MKNVVNTIEALKKAMYHGLMFDNVFRARSVVILNDDCTVNVYRNCNASPREFYGITGNVLFNTYHNNGQIEIHVPIIKSVEEFLKEAKISMEDLKKNRVCSTSLEVLVGFCCNKNLKMVTSYSYNDYKFVTLIEFLDEDGYKLNIKIHKSLPEDIQPEIVGHVNPRRRLWSDHVVEFENVYRWPDGTISALVGDNMPKSWHSVEEARDLPEPEFWDLPESILRGYADSEVIMDNVKYSVTPKGIFKAPITGYQSVDRTIEVTDGPSDGDSWGFGATRGSVTYKTTKTESIPIFGETVKISAADLPNGINSEFRNLVDGYEQVGYDYKKLIKLYKDREKACLDARDNRSRQQEELLQKWIDSQEWYQG